MPLLDLFWVMSLAYLFVILIWMLIRLAADIFRSDDLSGIAKAAWVVFIVVLPFFGIVAYLIARGSSIQERQLKELAARNSRRRGSDTSDMFIERAPDYHAGVPTEQELLTQQAELLG